MQTEIGEPKDLMLTLLQKSNNASTTPAGQSPSKKALGSLDNW